MTLHLYFARRFLAVFLALFALFAVLLSLIDMLEQIRSFDAREVGMGRVLRLTLLNMPAGLYRILPLITVLASVVLFLNLARSSELVVTRAAGRSGLHTLAAPVVVALGLGLLAVAGLNPIAAATQAQYESLSDRTRQGDASVMSLGRDGLWLRQGGGAGAGAAGAGDASDGGGGTAPGRGSGQTVIQADGASLDGSELHGVSFLSFDAAGSPVERIEAARARLTPGAWEVSAAKVWRLDAPNPEAGAREYATLRLASDLTLERIRDSFGAPGTVPIWELPAFIRQLEQAGFSARAHRTWLQMELALPLLMAAMVMAGAGFTMRHTRFGRTGLMVLLALGMGFAIFFLRNFAQILGERGQIPVALAAWSAPAIALLASLGLLLHLEDG